MKHQQHEQAQNLYFQTNLSKTEIADQLGVNRRTIMLWSQQGNWDKLRQSARHMPAFIAEKCYYLLDQYTSHLLTDGATMSTFTLKHAQAIHLMASSIKKIKNRSTVNEAMEMFTFFMGGLKQRDAKLAADLVPHIEHYISSRAGISTTDFLMEEFNPDGSLPYPEKQIQEKWQDEKDQAVLNQEYELFLKFQEQQEQQQTPQQTQPEQQHPQPESSTAIASPLSALHSASAPESAPALPLSAPESSAAPALPPSAVIYNPDHTFEEHLAANGLKMPQKMPPLDTIDQFREYMRSLAQNDPDQLNEAA